MKFRQNKQTDIFGTREILVFRQFRIGVSCMFMFYCECVCMLLNIKYIGTLWINSFVVHRVICLEVQFGRNWSAEQTVFRGYSDGVSGFSVWGQNIISMCRNKIGLSSLQSAADEVSIYVSVWWDCLWRRIFLSGGSFVILYACCGTGWAVSCEPSTCVHGRWRIKEHVGAVSNYYSTILTPFSSRDRGRLSENLLLGLSSSRSIRYFWAASWWSSGVVVSCNRLVNLVHLL